MVLPVTTLVDTLLWYQKRHARCTRWLEVLVVIVMGLDVS